MAATTTWIYLINLLIASSVMGIFVVILFIRFLKKKTVGTMLLTLSYLFLTLGELTVIGEIIYIATPLEDKLILGIAQIGFVVFYALGYLFLYFFGNRHILEDNDLLKALTTVFLTLSVGLFSGLMLSEMIHQVAEPLFYTSEFSTILQIDRPAPNTWVSVILFIPIFLLVHVRLIVKTNQIRKAIKNPIIKRGFTYILLSIVGIILSTVVISLEAIAGLTDSLYPLFILQILRIGLIIGSIALGYLGWIMPKWLKRRIRGKAWIAKQIERNVKTKAEPIASSTMGGENEKVTIEVK
ncbi:MAG: hypothetical protein GF308_20560 [Candidatus Heimdallarchaeota archaeon]|nr:hypothetical protein [Candidatus Heimdallarchaeota archaeon]